MPYSISRLKFHRPTNPWKCSISKIFLCIFLLIGVDQVIAQNTSELEKKKKKVEQNIKHTQDKLQKTKESKASTLKDYNEIQNKIDSRKNIISGFQSEILTLQSSLQSKVRDISLLEERIDKLKSEYGRIMRSAYKASLLTNEWMLILSSNSMNQAFNRWMYLRKIKKDRKAKANTIIAKQLELETELANLENIRSGKQVLLNKEQKQSTLLLNDLNKKNQLIASLNADEKKLIKTLNRQKKEQQAITREIENVIRKEIARKEKEAREKAERERKKEAERLAAEEARRNAGKKNESADASDISSEEKSLEIAEKNVSAKVKEKKAIVVTETPESAALSSDFQSNRGRLPWPVKRGVIIRGFGTQAHPELSHVTIQNNGIDIKTDPDAAVEAVFNGEVVHIAFLSGYKNTVMVNHGKYYTIYSNLESVGVSRGQKVKKGDLIGRAAHNADSGNTEVHFELWSKQSPLNPSLWLKR